MDYTEYASRLMSNRLNRRLRANRYPVTFEQWTILIHLEMGGKG